MATANATALALASDDSIEASAAEMAGDFPRYMVVDGDKVMELSDSERAMLKFSRALPADLFPDFLACARLKGDAFYRALDAFKAKLEPRRNELVGW